MKTLIIMRHARTAMHSSDGTDFSRHLTPEGFEESSAAGNYLRGKQLFPDFILSSAALRAAQTAEKVAVALGCSEAMIELDRLIYNTADKGMIARISEVEDVIDTLLVVGHNPTVTSLVRKVSEVRIDNMSPGSLIALNYQIDDWSELPVNKGEFLFFARPPFAGRQ
jgi:phosphohistidine phosphatase